MNTVLILTMKQALTELPSRREVVRALCGVGLLLGTGGLPDAANAKKRKRKKRKPKTVEPKPKPNEFGCFEIGDPCTSEED